MMDIEPKLNVERYRWIKSQLGTDLLNLDEEVSRIGHLVQDVGENTAFAMELRDTAKENLTLVTAKESSKVLHDPNKPSSDTKIWYEVCQTEAYQKAQADYSEARLDSAIWDSLRNAVDQKSYSMKSAVSLITAGYLTMDSIVSKRQREIQNLSSKRVRNESA
jgi:hypothetical protein